MKKILNPISAAILAVGTLSAAVANAQHARSHVIDTSAAAIVASARASALARPGSDRAMAEQLIREGAVVSANGRRTDVFVPNDIRSCSASLAIGSPTVDGASYGQPIDIRVIMLGTTIQTNDC